MKKIGFIAPYMQLAEEVAKLAEMTGREVCIRIADGNEAVEVAQKMIEADVGVMISRGGTALFLKENLPVPVVELTVQAIDVMRAVHAAKQHANRIGMCGYGNIIYDIDSIAGIYDVTLVPIITHKHESFEEKTQKIRAAADSVEYIVGDAMACQIAEKCGIKSTLIESGKTSILAALSESQKLLDALNREQERLRELQTILDYSKEGVIMLDKKCQIRYANQVAEELLNREEISGDINRFFPSVDFQRVLFQGEAILDEFIDGFGKTIIFNVIPI